MRTLEIDGESLNIEKVEAVARHRAEVVVSQEAQEKVNRCSAFMDRLVDGGEAIYGVTTGIGEFARIRVSPEQGAELQKRIVYSHAAGTGDPFPDDVVRAAMLCRANTLAKGYSGVRFCTLMTLISMLNRNVVPVVCEKGSLGTSGDLAPLAQLACVCIGAGKARYQGEVMSGGEAMRRAGIEPVKLTYKEGLGLINGPQMMAGGAALLLRDAERLLKNALIATAMTVDVLKGMERAFDARVQRVRPFAGQNVAARAVRRLVEGSEIMADPAGRVQDGYSLRCAPQITGPSIDAWHFARRTVEIEMNSAGDNPLFFPEDGIHIAAGNFHGQAVGMAMDYLAIAMSEVANLSERHTNRLLNPVLSGLPDFLVEGKGLNSGLMVAQYTAAALVSENKILSHPASVDSISVSADQEDHVSMGPIAVRKCAEILRNVRAALAIEMMCAAQAIDFRRPLSPGRGTRVAYREIRKTVPFLEDDRVLYPDIEKMVDLLRGDVILGAVEAEVGELGLIPDLEEGGESAPRAAAAAPGIRCACNELTEPRVFLLGALEIRGSECVRCRRVYLNEGDMGKAIEARSKMRERGVC